MRRIFILCLSIIISLSLLGCSKQISGVGSSSEKTTINDISQNAKEVFMKKAEEKGLTEDKVKSLRNMSFSEQEILNLSTEKIAEIFAPGTQLDGAGLFNPDNNQLMELKKYDIDGKMSIILGNLGYKYDEMLRLSAEEIDFIFPNTELMANLARKGYSEKLVQDLLEQEKSYKDIVQKALKK